MKFNAKGCTWTHSQTRKQLFNISLPKTSLDAPIGINKITNSRYTNGLCYLILKKDFYKKKFFFNDKSRNRTLSTENRKKIFVKLTLILFNKLRTDRFNSKDFCFFTPKQPIPNNKDR